MKNSITLSYFSKSFNVKNLNKILTISLVSFMMLISLNLRAQYDIDTESYKQMKKIQQEQLQLARKYSKKREVLKSYNNSQWREKAKKEFELEKMEKKEMDEIYRKYSRNHNKNKKAAKASPQ